MGDERRRRERIDRLLVERGLCESRARAQAMVRAGKVIAGERRIDKPGTMVPVDVPLRVRGQDHPFASRGGVKLRGALDAFAQLGLEVDGRVAMDVGASTGGFTDCLLQAGVSRVFAVDVGYGQLAWKLVQDPRVVVHERQNIRSLDRRALGEPLTLVVVDCSFISLTKVLPELPRFLAAQADVVVLVKPQFEVGAERVGKGGVVRSETDQADAVERVAERAREIGFEQLGSCESPIRGRDGNREFFLWLAWNSLRRS